MKGRKIEEMGVSSRGLYMRNIAGIIPNGSDICSTADIPELSTMNSERRKKNENRSCP